jgi:hypothetical protein
LLIFGDGVYSSYSYASKFLASVFAVAAAPQINVFSIHVLEAVRLRDKVFVGGITMLTAKTLARYFIFAVIIYFVATVAFFVVDITVDESLFLSMYAALTVLYGVICVESPYARMLPAFKAFNEIMRANFIFILFFCGSVFVAFFYKSIVLAFAATVLSQILIAYIYYFETKKRLRSWN